jgi:nucleotide-binding universal stress UspA family protein
MIKDILLNLTLDRDVDVTTAYAASLAKAFDAHLCGVAFVYEPVFATADAVPGLPVTFLEAQEAECRQSADEAVARLATECQRYALLTDAKQISATAESAPLRFAEIARAYDVVVLAQTVEGSSIDNFFAQEALFEAGRPIMFVPYIQSKPFKADSITVAWDGSRAATRAVSDAMPFLRRARKVDLISISEGLRPRMVPAGVDMARHLARHAFDVKLHELPGGIDIAPTILNFLSDNGSDMLVMGAYGHSRMREFVLGGVSRSILQTMTVPTLMSH